MIDIRPLAHVSAATLQGLIVGYTSNAKYAVMKTETAARFSLTLELTPLPQPYVKRYEPMNGNTIARYQNLPALGFCFGAYDGDQLIGLALAEPHDWNNSLWVHELHVAETHRRRGAGRQLVEALAAQGVQAGLRIMVCETQTTNVPAIVFYRRMEFHFEGVDLSHYSNTDIPDGEVAVFMKKRLP